MADVVEQVMQEMVPDLDDLRKKNIFSEEEIRHIVRRRRDFEYSLQRKPGRPQDVLNYVRYEIAMESLRRRRSDGLRWRKKSRSDYAGINHIHHIFSRGTKRYKQDLRLWYQHLDFCLRSGSSNVLTRVLMKAVKYHPRQVSLWLLAADRELQQGHVDAARKLLMRGLRCLPTSAKLLGEFLRLEVGVAGQLLSVQDMEDEVKVEQKDVWGPTKLVFKKGLAKLEGKADATATFLSASLALLQQARSKWASSCGFQEWSDSLTTAAASRRPGLVDSESPSSQVSDETAVKIWEVWWKQELQAGTAWSSLVETISSCSIPAVLLKATKVAREEGEDEALKALVSSEAAVSDPQSTLSILQELSVAMAGKKALQAIFQSLLQRAVAKHPTNLRLVMVAGDHEKALALLDDVTQLSSQDAASLMLLKRKSLEKTAGAAPCGREVEQVLRAIEQGQDVAPALLAVLSEVTAHKGAAAFAKACREIRKLADNLWDVPKLRALILQEVLEAELRLLHVNQAVEVKDVAKSFEELLSAVGPSDVFVWLRYLEFAQEVFGAAGAPSPSDLHLRALRSVKDQDLYREKAQQILQGLDL